VTPPHVEEALREVGAEALEYLGAWGTEHPLDGTGGPEAERSALTFRTACVQAFAEGRGTWRALAMDRLMSAFAEEDSHGLRGALLDAAGLLVAWAADLAQRPEAAVSEAPR
jgi:hypothetical protein